MSELDKFNAIARAHPAWPAFEAEDQLSPWIDPRAAWCAFRNGWDAAKRRAAPNRRLVAEYTPDEHESAMNVLARLGKRNGIAYSGSAGHVALIVARLREGVTEFELRAIVARQADLWSSDPKMREYLKPETLFGPKTIAKYLDPARTEYRDQIAEMERAHLARKSRQLELVR